MAIPQIPTLSEIKARIVSDLNNKLNQTTPALPKAFNNVLAGAIAGLILLLYKSIAWTYKQIFPSTADEVSLKLLGAIVNIFQLPAEFAILEVEIPGNEGYTPPENTEFKSPDGFVYKITDTTAIVSGSAICKVTALASGESSNQIDGTELSIIKTDSQLLGIATVTTTISSGDDAEDIDAFRARVTSAYQNKRTGGSPADYRAWGLETPNFDYINPLDSPTTAGDVQVYGRVDNQEDGIPTGSQLTELYNYLTVDPTSGLRTRHPIGPPVQVLPISRYSFDIEIFIQNSTASLESDITEAITNSIETKQPYNEAVDSVTNNTISEGGIADTGNNVATAQNATIINVILKQTIDNLAITSYQLFGGEFGKVNSITYTEVI